MNIKSLLLGSAAALAAVSGAQAADAIVAAAPEPMEYVRVCDAFGTGYFYIPGTETCLQISGGVRFNVQFGEDTYDVAPGGAGDGDWDMAATAWVGFNAKSDTELGVLESNIVIWDDISYDGEGSSPYFDEAWLALGGFKAGWFYNWWDSGIAGETDDLQDTSEFVSAAYTYTADAFSVGVSIDEIDNATTHDIGLSGTVTGSFGAVTASLLGGYDFDAEEGAVRAILSAGVGPGTFQFATIYASGQNVYYDQAEWTLAAAYALKATEKFTITPAAQYWINTADAGAGTYFTSDDDWKVGVTFDYTPVENLLARVAVNYQDSSDNFSGYFRLQRSF